MRRPHPLWRGFYLALTLAVLLTLLGSMDALSPYRLERRPMALFAAVAAGAFFASLPGRFRQGWRWPLRASWQRCLLCFACGLLLALSLGMAGDGRVLFALMQGSTGAYAFVGIAWLAGFVTVRLAERGRRA